LDDGGLAEEVQDLFVVLVVMLASVLTSNMSWIGTSWEVSVVST
jgi:hypothetical protein